MQCKCMSYKQFHTDLKLNQKSLYYSSVELKCTLLIMFYTSSTPWMFVYQILWLIWLFSGTSNSVIPHFSMLTSFFTEFSITPAPIINAIDYKKNAVCCLTFSLLFPHRPYVPSTEFRWLLREWADSGSWRPLAWRRLHLLPVCEWRSSLCGGRLRPQLPKPCYSARRVLPRVRGWGFHISFWCVFVAPLFHLCDSSCSFDVVVLNDSVESSFISI